MTAIPALRSRPAVAAPAASALFGLVLGAATYLLHGVSPVFERATNSSSSWIVWTALAGALVPRVRTAAACGALMMIMTCAGYYATSSLNGTFGSGGIPTALVWAAAGTVGGPLVGAAGWAVRRETGIRRHLGVALIGAVVAGEGLYLGLELDYWGEAAAFLGLGAVLTAALTWYRARETGPRPWLPVPLMPAVAAAYFGLEAGVLNALLG
ncbi:DUF6518 family protein [Streptomyces sp. NPDC088732]|uniref:DUF6518 family protein n=1 Tax=Streptomyces sp. NPDC088732 TaxID=3365879 RepID=UPI0037FA15E6